MKQLTEYWLNLKPNEQLLVKVAGAVFVVFFLIVAIIQPLNAKIEKAEKELIKQQKLAVFVAQSVAKLKAGGSAKAISGGSLTQIINRSSGRYGVTITKMQPNNNSVRLTLEQVEFNSLLSWLKELVEQHGARIANIDITKSSNEGYVIVSRLVLEK